MEHRYDLDLTWQGNHGTGTSGLRDYGRDVLLCAEGKPDLCASADPTFRGDASRWNPEELLLAALATCHLLSYLHAAVRHGVVVTAYDDRPECVLDQIGQGGRVVSATLRPRVVISDDAHVGLASALHREAAEHCFIAASVNFPVRHEPETLVQPA